MKQTDGLGRTKVVRFSYTRQKTAVFMSIGIRRNDGNRPDGIIVDLWQQDRRLVWDAMYVDSMAIPQESCWMLENRARREYADFSCGDVPQAKLLAKTGTFSLPS